jgi:hypothetical protein
LELVARANFSFFCDGEIETATAAPQKSSDYVISLKLGGQFETWQTRRGYPDDGRAYSIAVSDRNRGF